MNERIQELAEQAYDIVEFNYAPPQKIFNMKKFAELIVRECADLVDRAISDGGADGRVVKEHFGVEE